MDKRCFLEMGGRPAEKPRRRNMENVADTCIHLRKNVQLMANLSKIPPRDPDETLKYEQMVKLSTTKMDEFRIRLKDEFYMQLINSIASQTDVYIRILCARWISMCENPSATVIQKTTDLLFAISQNRTAQWSNVVEKDSVLSILLQFYENAYNIPFFKHLLGHLTTPLSLRVFSVLVKVAQKVPDVILMKYLSVDIPQVVRHPLYFDVLTDLIHSMKEVHNVIPISLAIVKCITRFEIPRDVSVCYSLYTFINRVGKRVPIKFLEYIYNGLRTLTHIKPHHYILAYSALSNSPSRPPQGIIKMLIEKYIVPGLNVPESVLFEVLPISFVLREQGIENDIRDNTTRQLSRMIARAVRMDPSSIVTRYLHAQPLDPQNAVFLEILSLYSHLPKIADFLALKVCRTHTHRVMCGNSSLLLKVAHMNVINSLISVNRYPEIVAQKKVRMVDKVFGYGQEERFVEKYVHRNVTCTLVDMVVGWLNTGFQETHARIPTTFPHMRLYQIYLLGNLFSRRNQTVLESFNGKILDTVILKGFVRHTLHSNIQDETAVYFHHFCKVHLHNITDDIISLKIIHEFTLNIPKIRWNELNPLFAYYFFDILAMAIHTIRPVDGDNETRIYPTITRLHDVLIPFMYTIHNESVRSYVLQILIKLQYRLCKATSIDWRKLPGAHQSDARPSIDRGDQMMLDDDEGHRSYGMAGEEIMEMPTYMYMRSKYTFSVMFAHSHGIPISYDGGPAAGTTTNVASKHVPENVRKGGATFFCATMNRLHKWYTESVTRPLLYDFLCAFMHRIVHRPDMRMLILRIINSDLDKEQVHTIPAIIASYVLLGGNVGGVAGRVRAYLMDIYRDPPTHIIWELVTKALRAMGVTVTGGEPEYTRICIDTSFDGMTYLPHARTYCMCINTFIRKGVDC